jgi:hypothetical protein
MDLVGDKVAFCCLALGLSHVERYRDGQKTSKEAQ